MRYFLGSVLVALALAVGPAGAGAPANSSDGQEVVRTPSYERVGASAEFVEGEVLVRFKPGVSVAEQAEIAATRGGRVGRALLLPRTKIVRLPAGASVRAAAAALSRRADVEYAEPNWISRLSAVPNDTRFGELHGFNQANDADIDMPEGWDFQTGNSGVIVAVADSGVAIDHPDLDGNIWVNDDPVGGGDNDGNTFTDDTNGWDFVQNDRIVLDYNGHGTHVAGTIGAEGNNSLGVPGVNWDVSIMPVRVADANGSLEDADIANGITYACNNGADILNGSFGGPTLSMTVANAITSPACANTLMVFAAGNEGLNLSLSSSYPCELHLPPPNGVSAANVLCVAATGPSDELAAFSNRGSTSVHLGAPGVNTLSTWPGYQTISGPDGFDDATQPLFDARWGDRTTVDGTHPQWNRTTTVKDSGTHSLTDSPAGNYASNQLTTIRGMAPFSLLTRVGCRVDYDMRLATEESFDFFEIYAGTTTATPTQIEGWSGSTGGAFIPEFSSDLSMFDGQPTVYIRMGLNSDFTINDDGVYLDDVLVKCLAPGGEDYNAIDGTSMATPHVAGVAGLLVAQNPSRTVAQLKSLLTSTVDPTASLVGRTITGGRLNACKALGGTCGYTPPPPTCPTDGLPPGGAIFGGAHQGGGSVCFVLSSDFNYLQRFRAEDIPGNVCLFNFVQRTYGSPGVPLQGPNRAFSNTASGFTVNGSLAGQNASGNLRMQISTPFSCDTGVLTWTALTNATPPGPAPGPLPPPPGATGGPIVGTPGPDVLTGTPGPDVIFGLGGNDVINGLGGNDRIEGGPGNDRILGGAGNDTLLGQAGNDTIIGGPGNDALSGQAGKDKLLAKNAGNDKLNGGPGRDSGSWNKKDRAKSIEKRLR